MSGYDIYIRGAILIMLLVLSSIFSSSETALTSLTPGKIRQVKEYDIEGSKLLKRIKKKLNTILVTILIGNNIVNIAATAILTEMILKVFSGENATFIATITMTILILIFGEITPKTYAAQHPERIALKVSRPLEILAKIFKPLLILLDMITTMIIKMMGGKITNNAPFVTEEDIRSLVDAGEEEGILEHGEKEMIEGIFEIDDIDVTDIMIPRIDIKSVSEDSSIHKALDSIITYGHSRIPVYQNTIDNITGILYAKDILPFMLDKNQSINKISITKLMRKAYYVPETKKTNELLKEIQQKKIHMAIVLDEYGGTEGLITIEDILEEIVGDIFDEYDNEVKLIDKIKENVYLIRAEVSLEEINDMFDLDLPEEDFDSLGGYVFGMLGRVPVVGDSIEYEEYIMTVTKLQNKRIKRIEMKKIEE